MLEIGVYKGLLVLMFFFYFKEIEKFVLIDCMCYIEDVEVNFVFILGIRGNYI